jgi:hypothetical protein
MSFINDLIGGITGQAGATAANQAGQIQSGAITQAAQLGAQGQEELQALIAQQLGITQEQFAPFLAAGTGALPGVASSATAGGLGANLDDIMGSDYFQGLVDQRTQSVEGMLGAGGLTRSGAAITEGAAIPTDLAMQIEQMLSGRQSNLAGMGLNAATQGASAGGNLFNQLTSSMNTGLQNQMSGITGAAGATASGILGGAQSQAAGMQNLLNLGGVLGAAAISDPRLKENIVKVGEIAGLGIYEWDYIDEVKDSSLAVMKSGFMADEVKDVYPQHVVEFAGYDLIDYKSLLNEIEPCLQ